MSDDKTYFNLVEGESIVWEGAPLPGYRTLLFATNFVPLLFFILAGFGIIFSSDAGDSFGIFVGFIGGVVVLGFLIAFASAHLHYSKEYYWITTKRLVQKHGFIGYRVNSIPLERVSDVVISRSFIESFFGFSSVHVQSLAGQVSYGRFGAEGKLAAVAEPEKIQHMILELIRANRKSEKLTI